MKIKYQFSIFLTCIFLIPLACALLLPIFHIFSDYHNQHLKLFEQFHKENESLFSQETKEDVLKSIRHMPKGVDFLIEEGGLILFCTSDEFKTGTKFNEKEAISFIRSTSSEYTYMVETPGKKSSHGESDSKLRIISRIKKDTLMSNIDSRITNIAALIIVVIGIISITSVLIISKSISRSVKKILNQSQQIAAGNLDAKIEEFELPDNEFRIISDNINTMRKNLLEDKNRKARFVMGISHDLRTPIAVIKGYTEGIQDGVIKPGNETEKSLSIIREKSDLLESMINDLIDYVKLDSTDWTSELISENFTDFIKDFTSNLDFTGSVFKKKINIKINLPENTPIIMNKKLLTRALENIFSNALRYTDENDEINISSYRNKEFIYCEIADTGHGIKKEDLSHIFDLFYRASKSRQEKGIGIGLAVVKNIIDIHEWEIFVDSEPGKGTSFKIRIPVNTNGKKIKNLFR